MDYYVNCGDKALNEWTYKDALKIACKWSNELGCDAVIICEQMQPDHFKNWKTKRVATRIWREVIRDGKVIERINKPVRFLNGEYVSVAEWEEYYK